MVSFNYKREASSSTEYTNQAGIEARVADKFEQLLSAKHKDYPNLAKAVNDALPEYAAMHPGKLKALFEEQAIMPLYLKKWSEATASDKKDSERNIKYSKGLDRIIRNIPNWVKFDKEILSHYSKTKNKTLEEAEIRATRRFQYIVSSFMGVLGVDAAENVAINIHEKYKNDLNFIFGFPENINNKPGYRDSFVDVLYTMKSEYDTHEKIIQAFQEALWVLNNTRMPYDQFIEKLVTTDHSAIDNNVNRGGLALVKIGENIRKNGSARLTP